MASPFGKAAQGKKNKSETQRMANRRKVSLGWSLVCFDRLFLGRLTLSHDRLVLVRRVAVVPFPFDHGFRHFDHRHRHHRFAAGICCP